MNENFGLHVRHNTLKKYQENYESDLKIYLNTFEDDTEPDFLEVDLFSHQEFLKYLETRGPETYDLDEGVLNHKKINDQKRIIAFIENKIDEAKDVKDLTIYKTLDWKGTELQFTELTKTLIETKFISPELTQKEIFKRMKHFFNVNDFDEADKIKQVTNRSSNPLIEILETTLNNFKSAQLEKKKNK